MIEERPFQITAAQEVVVWVLPGDGRGHGEDTLTLWVYPGSDGKSRPLDVRADSAYLLLDDVNHQNSVSLPTEKLQSLSEQYGWPYGGVWATEGNNSTQITAKVYYSIYDGDAKLKDQAVDHVLVLKKGRSLVELK